MVDAQAIGMTVYAAPSSDGYEVWVWAELPSRSGPPISGILCDDLSGTCRTMVCVASGCGGALTNLPSGTTVVGQLWVIISLASAQTLESGPLAFTRAFVATLELTRIAAPDNLLKLTFFPNSLPADTYILILAASAPPGALPTNHRLVGRPYTIRASGALALSDCPMALHLAYDALWLGDASPHNLSIFAWAPYDQVWMEKGGTLFAEHSFLSVLTQGFTTYALMETPSWRDTFADDSGLFRLNSTSPTSEGGLILDNRVLSGTAISAPITPTVAGARWDRLVFTQTTPAATDLRVDVLSMDGVEVLTDVASGINLTSLDITQYPSLRLRATLSSGLAGQSPVLNEWRVSWQATWRRVYLPVVLK